MWIESLLDWCAEERAAALADTQKEEDMSEIKIGDSIMDALDRVNRGAFSDSDGWDKAAAELVVLLRSKQADYGPENIMSTGHVGLAVRLTDKVARLRNLTLNSKEPKNESLRDTYMDVAGYGIIGMMLMDGRFPDEV